MKIKPAIKCKDNKYYFSDWIISNFPENYPQMTYLEPYCGSASVLMNKIHSIEEAINDIDASIIRILRAIRDQKDEFVKQVKKKVDNPVVKDFKDKNPDLKEAIQGLSAISSRLEKVFILNELGVQVINAYSDQNVLAYVDPPQDMNEVEQTQLANILHNFKGKVVLTAFPTDLHKELYADWKNYKKVMQKEVVLWKNY